MKQNIETLKEYFETGDKPTQQNYADLIDSLAMPMIGEIKAVSYAFAPQGWAKCNGQLLDPAAYPELFALIGTTYGGDGTTTFAVPNLVAKVPLGYGNTPGYSSYTIGQVGGEETNTLTEDQLPAHSHSGNIDSGAIANVTIPASSTNSSNNPLNSYMGSPSNIGPNTINIYSNSTDTLMQPFTAPISGTVTTDSTGNGTNINNLQPYLAINYIIAVEGINPMQ
jgi:microcystin-dependent protein